MNKSFITTTAILAGLISFSSNATVKTVDMKPLSEHIRVSQYKGNVQSSKELPQITWAEDIRTVLANGSSQVTKNGSTFDQYNLDYKLVLKDSVINQAKDYISGKTHFSVGH